MHKESNKPLSKLLFTGLGLLLACLLNQTAFAADADAPSNAKAGGAPQSPVVVTLTQYKLGQDEKCAPHLQDAKVVMPGDVMEYRATYKNQGTTTLSVVATLPVPEGLEYIPDSAMALSANKSRLLHTVALKESQFAAEPLMRKVVLPDGTNVTHAVPYAEYRFVRWNLEQLAPGASVEVSLRARVAQTTEQSAEVAK
jgi:uncharacterized repeat protein (TIGR01451 family)